ncbi:MAG: hypothetical protein ACI837_003451 [Crocinitomicaceae bacterium]|jgi:hypothetical protein
MSDVNAYGGGNECDILINGCYTSGIPDGVRAVGVAASPPNQDQIALALSGPLTMGTTYTLTFSTYSEVSFRVQGDVEIGASTSNSAFGTLIFTAPTVAFTWVNHSVTFVAPNNATNITVRNIAGVIHWNHVDNFAFDLTLPIELLNFNAIPVDNNKVKLDWETVTEINNDYFIIERSKLGSHWEEIGRLNGAGSSTSSLNYTSYDNDPYLGTSYYRLKQVDFDGKYEYSPVVAVTITDAPSRISVYPNPTLNSVTLEGSEVELSELKIFDVLGQNITEKIEINQKSNSVITLDLSNMPSGIYTLKTKTSVVKVCKN